MGIAEAGLRGCHQVLAVGLLLLAAPAWGQSGLFYPLKNDGVRSMKVVRLSDGKTIMAENPGQRLTPASVTKLFTSAAILDGFGPHQQITTDVLYTGSRKGATITGKLVVKGNGDPYLTSEKIWQLAADLRHLGIRSVTGGLIIDNSLFNDGFRDASRAGSTRSSRNAYDAPISALGINFNTVTVAVAPGDKVGQRARVSLDPYPLAGVTIKGTITTSRRGRKNAIRVVRLSDTLTGLTLKVSGSIAQGSKMTKIYRSVRQPVWSTGEQLRAFFAGAGIQVKGKVAAGRAPKGAKPLIAIEGFPIGFIVKGLNKFSNNYIADVLTKKLGEVSGYPDKNQPSMLKGIGAINGFLSQKVGLKKGYVLKNGSGLDNANKLSADDVMALLVYMYRRSELFPEYIVSLAVAGEDGTLKKRFNKLRTRPLTGIIRAKTGTLTKPVSVAGIAGYFYHPVQGMMAFVIIDNGKPGKRQPNILDLRERQDVALSRIYQKLNQTVH